MAMIPAIMTGTISSRPSQQLSYIVSDVVTFDYEIRSENTH
jgi:hypothetical protein